MSLLKDCAKTFVKCLAIGSGQMIGMALGTDGVHFAGKAIVNVIDEMKKPKTALPTSKPYRRMVIKNIEDQQ